MSVFNSQSTIEVGGILSDAAAANQDNNQQFRKRRASESDGSINDFFIGQMGNLIFNDVPVFEQAKLGTFKETNDFIPSSRLTKNWVSPFNIKSEV